MPELLNELRACTGFQWDAGNVEKNWQRHGVTPGEAEQVFFNRPMLVAQDLQHSRKERRFAALGQTTDGRLLALVFTIRETLIRVISVRDMSRRERRVYERQEEG